MYDSTYFVKEKRIAFIKFLIDLVGVRARYRSNQFELERRGDLPHMILDIMKSSAKIIWSFIKLKNLSNDLFCTGEIQTIDYSLEVYWQFLNNESFDPLLWNSFEIKLTLTKLHPELLNFKKQIKIFLQKLLNF